MPTVFSGAAVLTPLGDGPNGTLLFQIPASVECSGRCRQLFRIAGTGGPLGRRMFSKSSTMQYTAIATRSITVGAGQLADYSPESLAAGEVVFFQSWTSSIGILKTNAAWNPATRTLSTASPINTECYGACLNRYFVQNVLDAKLMAPGTFSLDDRDVSNRTIMYKPLPGETVAPGDLAVGNISEVLVTASTDGSSKPGFVTMRGITFSHTASALSYCINSGCNGQSASSGQTATVHLTNATNFEFFNCTVSETGHYGVWVDQGSSDVSVSHCNFTSLGAGGIRIGAARSGVAPDLTQQVQRATVSDCTVSNTGAVVMAGAGVLSQQASDVLITHNNIGNLLYTGVSAGWTWGYAPTSVHNVTVSFNDIHDIFQGELSDGGCVYTLGIQPGSLVDNNRCWNVHSAGYGGWGTYTDEGSSFITFSNNLIYNTKSAGHHQVSFSMRWWFWLALGHAAACMGHTGVAALKVVSLAPHAHTRSIMARTIPSRTTSSLSQGNGHAMACQAATTPAFAPPSIPQAPVVVGRFHPSPSCATSCCSISCTRRQCTLPSPPDSRTTL